MDERKNLLGPNLIKNENIMPLLYQFLKVYQLKMTKQYQTRTVFENISTSIMTVDYSRVPSPSSCVPLPPLGGGGGDGPTTTLSPLPYHKQGVKKFRASENILLPYRLFTAIGDFQIFSQILFAYLAQEAKYCVMTFSASPSQGASVQPQWFRVPRTLG